jgi:hypothetical protein
MSFIITPLVNVGTYRTGIVDCIKPSLITKVSQAYSEQIERSHMTSQSPC